MASSFIRLLFLACESHQNKTFLRALYFLYSAYKILNAEILFECKALCE